MEVVFKLQNIGDAINLIQIATTGNNVFALHGEMGAGKTTFVHAWCQSLGVKGVVSSPTFSIINEYVGGSNETIYHIDLYRLKDAEEAISTGVEDCLFSGTTCFVEWPERAASIFPNDTIHLYLYVVDNNTRRITFNE